ncbi:hypothetical protein GTA08_BOTSDO11586 [Botryosphaeria dothidea]|uniref:Uncharacterized protein n=1 Tax=Botryosphaeria dothidea TaxID=55169 RepID=A0A8H4J5Y0_9PEZI|nr:hypothetical protein GTA08_BOTSDO11586 [Botryosphaeria dothidea]
MSDDTQHDIIWAVPVSPATFGARLEAFANALPAWRTVQLCQRSGVGGGRFLSKLPQELMDMIFEWLILAHSQDNHGACEDELHCLGRTCDYQTAVDTRSITHPTFRGSNLRWLTCIFNKQHRSQLTSNKLLGLLECESNFLKSPSRMMMRKALAEEFGLNVHATFAGEREPDSEQDWKSHLLRYSSMMHPNERPHVDITFWVSSIKFTNAWRLRDLRHIYSDHGEYFVIDEDQEKVPKSAQRGFRKASRWLGLELSPLDDGESAEKASFVQHGILGRNLWH